MEWKRISLTNINKLLKPNPMGKANDNFSSRVKCFEMVVTRINPVIKIKKNIIAKDLRLLECFL